MTEKTEKLPATHNDLGQRPRDWRRRLRGRALVIPAIAAAASAGLVAMPIPSYAATTSHVLLKARTVPGYGQVLVNSQGFTLYSLSSEGAGKITCTAACLKFWPPLLVGATASANAVSLGPGIAGTIGFVKLSSTTKQVTFDGYPLYTFVKDTKPGQVSGEGIVKFGGTWGMLHVSNLIMPTKTAASKSSYGTTSGYGTKSGSSGAKSGSSGAKSGSSGGW